VLFVASGGVGLAGLVAGRWAADSWGRRPGAGAGLALTAAAGFAAYSGGGTALAAGFLLSTFAASVFAPAAGALDAEIFPTTSRSTAAGWLAALQVLGGVVGLVLFGSVADALGSFSAAALAVTAPSVAASLLYLRLPETRGREIEDTAG
jgi:MFS transporter, putative metabolite:H+ symporter